MVSDVLKKLRKNREGIQRERTLRAIYLVLSDWCLFKYGPNPSTAAPRGKMDAIPFDKLIMIVARIWDELFSRTGAKFKGRDLDSITEEETDQAVTFPIPFSELPGKHGPGRAVKRKDDRPEFLVSVLYRLRQEGILPYFDIYPPADAPGVANHYRTTVEPALASASDDTLLEDFTKKEREALCDLKNGLKRLSADEIRALGTHSVFEKTALDVEREFGWMRKFLVEVEENLRGGKPFLSAAEEILEFADEACRKSEGNHDVYARARSIVEGELTQPDVKAAFLTCQKSPNEIWNRNEMTQLARRARLAYLRARYLECVAYWSVPDQTGTSHRKKESALDEPCAKLALEGILGLPASLDLVFAPNTRNFRDGVLEKLLAVVADLKNP